MTGIERITQAFKKPGVKIMSHIVGGYPDLQTSERILRSMAAHGADIIEVQLPFSDPPADGPAIVYANHKALAAGVTTPDVLAMMIRVRRDCETPLLIMSYMNPIYAYGEDRIIQEAADAGIDGFIVPDCPVEEREAGFIEKCNKAGLAFVPLVAPSTGKERMKELTSATFSPFVYAVLRLGVTGKKTELDAASLSYLADVKKETGRYVAAGFGIAEKNQIDALASHADCAIIGSAITRTITKAVEDGKDAAAEIETFMKALR